MSAIIPARMRSAGELALAVQGYAERGWPVLPLWWPLPAGACVYGRSDRCKPAWPSAGGRKRRS